MSIVSQYIKIGAMSDQIESSIPMTPKVLVIEPRTGLGFSNLNEVWENFETFKIFVWRDIQVRYKQTIMGIAWAWIQPLMLVLIYSIFFGYLARFPSGDFPYPVFVLIGIVVWQFFARSCNDGCTILVANSAIISKLYFPRLILPLASVVGGLVEFGVASVVLIAVILFYGIVPDIRVLAAPLIIAVLLVMSTGAAIWLSALNAKHRDFNLVVPVILQVGFFTSPIIYSTELVPERFLWLYGLNPMVGILESIRWSLGGNAHLPLMSTMASSVVSAVVIFVTSLIYFRHVENTLADRL